MTTATKANPEIGKTIMAAGRKTNYLEEGTGFPVLMIHGSGPGVTGYANWRGTIPALAPHFQVFAPDMAGFGYTERHEGETYNLDLWVEHIIGFMDAVGIEKAHLVGNSFGGALSVRLAVEFPDRVEKIVLMGAAGLEFELTEGLDAVWGYEATPEYMLKMMQKYFAYDPSLINEELARSRYEASIRPGYQESYSSMFPVPRQRHLAMLATPEDKIAAMPHSVLIVQGREDKVVPLESSMRYHQLIKKSEIHIFGECGHWTQIEKRERFNLLVQNFLLD